MSNELTPYHASGVTDLEIFHGSFLVPKDWKTCGPAVYISGAPGLSQIQPIALALTKTSLSLCGPTGPVWSLPVGAIQDVKVEELLGVSFPINTPSGIVQMVPPLALGLTVSFKLTITGAIGRLQIYMLSPQSAREWVNDIHTAIYNYASEHTDIDRR